MSQGQTPATRSPDGESGARPTEEQVREELTRVLASHEFRSSKRSQDFLRYVVENTLRGHADMLKERTIGIEVFGRPTSYDPSDDATVRVRPAKYANAWASTIPPMEPRTRCASNCPPAPMSPRSTPSGAACRAAALRERPAPPNLLRPSQRPSLRGGPAHWAAAGAAIVCRDRPRLLGHCPPGRDRPRPVLGAGAARHFARADRRRVRSGVESRPAARRAIASAARRISSNSPISSWAAAI